MLLIAHVSKPGEEVEAEPVTVIATEKVAWLILDDGTKLLFDAGELRRAVDADVLADEKVA